MTIDPTLPFKLIDRYGFTQHDIGLFILFFTATCALLTIGLLFVPERTPKLPLIVTGSFFLAVSPFLIGPSRLFGIPDTLSVQQAGLVIGGLGKALVMSFVYGWGCDSAASIFPNEVEEANNVFAELYSVFFPLSIAILPLLGSGLNKSIGFEYAMEVIGSLLGIFAILLVIFFLTNNKSTSS